MEEGYLLPNPLEGCDERKIWIFGLFLLNCFFHFLSSYKVFIAINQRHTFVWTGHGSSVKIRSNSGMLPRFGPEI